MLGPLRATKGPGRVFKALQQDPHREVVLKIPREGALLDEKGRERFRREIEASVQIAHSAIVPILDTGIHHAVPYYVMPLVHGVPLDECAQQEQDLSKRLCLFEEICEAVSAIHERRWVHRDLKPDNILVDKYRHVHILDFGLAKALQETGTQLTEEGEILGTRQTMAPEQTMGNWAAVDTRTDVYALGIILYFLLTGQYPYKIAGPREQAYRIIREMIPAPPSSINPMTDKRLDEVVKACLSKSPEGRPADATALLKSIREILSAAMPAKNATHDADPAASQNIATENHAPPPAKKTQLLILVVIPLLCGLIVMLPQWMKPSNKNNAVEDKTGTSNFSTVSNVSPAATTATSSAPGAATQPVTVPPVNTTTTATPNPVATQPVPVMPPLPAPMMLTQRPSSKHERYFAEANRTLRGDHARRNDAALLVQIPSSAEKTGWLSTESAGDKTQNPADAGSIVIVYVAGGHLSNLSWRDSKTEHHGRIQPQKGEILYAEFPPTQK